MQALLLVLSQPLQPLPLLLLLLLVATVYSREQGSPAGIEPQHLWVAHHDQQRLQRQKQQSAG